MTMIRRMIDEIESYLASPTMRDAQEFWLQEERRSLGELLDRLRAENARS
jgi:hypothetical protein